MSRSDSNQDFQIRLVSESDIPELARLHRGCYSESFLSLFGKSMLERYLGWLTSRTRNRPCTLVAEDESGLIGYMSGGCYTENVQVSFMKEHRFHLALGMILRPRIMLHPDFKLKIRRAWMGLRRYGVDAKGGRATHNSSESSSRWSPVRFHVLSVAVSSRGRRRGIGSALLSKGASEARDRDCAFMDAVVRASNTASLGLFTSFGFKIVDPAGDSIQVKYVLA